jgi:hypothetical protein
MTDETVVGEIVETPGPLEQAKPRPPHLFQPGQSGNPSGRPRGLMRMVQKRCGANGEQLVAALLVIATSKPADRKKFFGETVRVSTRDRILAIRELCDRGWGRPAQSVDISGAGNTQIVVVTGMEDLRDRP